MSQRGQALIEFSFTVGLLMFLVFSPLMGTLSRL